MTRRTTGGTPLPAHLIRGRSGTSSSNDYRPMGTLPKQQPLLLPSVPPPSSLPRTRTYIVSRLPAFCLVAIGSTSLREDNADNLKE
ncbi:hypothetical protein QJS10_CPA06g02060 [Acorus calamus]|uniref:Uncharacterized protein n=1 Tax=Acorus calamus TaxID=4465 RepID=A0AAV9ELX1_ACOCL|nr:hypothetical protein QJS10_CPA06g02060 [Acorus calamus]